MILFIIGSWCIPPKKTPSCYYLWKYFFLSFNYNDEAKTRKKEGKLCIIIIIILLSFIQTKLNPTGCFVLFFFLSRSYIWEWSVYFEKKGMVTTTETFFKFSFPRVFVLGVSSSKKNNNKGRIPCIYKKM